MKFALKTAHGWISAQPGPASGPMPPLEYRPLESTPGVYESFELVPLDAPAPVPAPPSTSWPPVIGGDYHGWFLKLVEGRPFSMETLQALNDEGALGAANVVLSPRNANHDLTKIGIPVPNGADERTWVRVGFGEGHWVWMIQPPTS